jgi:2-keto-4-pentenoate hydratase
MGRSESDSEAWTSPAEQRLRWEQTSASDAGAILVDLQGGFRMPQLSAADVLAASDFLGSLGREGRHAEAIPPAYRPRTRAEGYAIQALCEGWSARPLWGWKIAATSIAGQKHINVEGPLAGRLLAEGVVPEGVPVALAANRMRVAEVEFVFRMRRTLTPRSTPYTSDEVMAAIAALHLGVEIPDSRYRDFVTAGAPQLIADRACAHLFVLGREVTAAWREQDLSVCAVQGRTSAGLAHDGGGANVLGDPRIALTWLANELSAHGVTLGEGQLVTTGACVAPLPIGPGDVVTADYGPFGTMQVRFEA